MQTINFNAYLGRWEGFFFYRHHNTKKDIQLCGCALNFSLNTPEIPGYKFNQSEVKLIHDQGKRTIGIDFPSSK